MQPTDATRHHTPANGQHWRAAYLPATTHQPNQAAQTQISLHLVGNFTVYRAGIRQPTATIGPRKARALLALLTVQPERRPVTIDHIIDALWGPTPPRNPKDNISTLVSRLRINLGNNIITGNRPAYHLGDQPTIDLNTAHTLITQAEHHLTTRPHTATTTAIHALNLIDHDTILTDHPDAPWANPTRNLHTELLRRARHTAAIAALQEHDTTLATAIATTATTTDPLDETAYRILMSAHHQAGEPARALTTYNQLRHTLANELGVDPAPTTRQLHTTILQRNAINAIDADNHHTDTTNHRLRLILNRTA